MSPMFLELGGPNCSKFAVDMHRPIIVAPKACFRFPICYCSKHTINILRYVDHYALHALQTLLYIVDADRHQHVKREIVAIAPQEEKITIICHGNKRKDSSI